MIAQSDWQWYGTVGHFICGRDCRFHLATKVGKYLVSTIGQFFPDSQVRKILAESRGITLTQRGDAGDQEWLDKVGWEPIGAWGTYETLVFEAGDRICDSDICGCKCPIPTKWGELAGERYDNAADATAGHYKYCEMAARGEIKADATLA